MKSPLGLLLTVCCCCVSSPYTLLHTGSDSESDSESGSETGSSEESGSRSDTEDSYEEEEESDSEGMEKVPKGRNILRRKNKTSASDSAARLVFTFLIYHIHRMLLLSYIFTAHLTLRI